MTNEIKSKSLATHIENITTAMNNMKDEKVQSNVQLLLENAKVLQMGEKRLRKELQKREEQLIEIDYEIKIIRELAGSLNYDLVGESNDD